MKTLSTFLILSASALAFGFARPGQDQRSAADALPYTAERPAVMVIRYDPGRIYLTDTLVGALLDPVRPNAGLDPQQRLHLIPTQHADRQPKGVYVAQVMLGDSAPEDLPAREEAIMRGLEALEKTLEQRITAPQRKKAEQTLRMLNARLDEATHELDHITHLRAQQMAADRLRAQERDIADRLKMLEVELAASRGDRDRSRAAVQVAQEYLAAVESEVDRTSVEVARTSKLVESGMASHAELAKAESNLAATRADLAAARNNVVVGAVDLENSESVRERLNEQSNALKQMHADLVDKVQASDKHDERNAAHQLEFELSRSVLQSKVETLQQALMAQESAALTLSPVSVERW